MDRSYLVAEFVSNRMVFSNLRLNQINRESSDERGGKPFVLGSCGSCFFTRPALLGCKTSFDTVSKAQALQIQNGH